jgi:hypothetical protein
MKRDELNRIHEDYEFLNEKSKTYLYSIKSELELFPGEYLEVSDMFKDKIDLEEAGITYHNRIVTAFTPSGYEQLKQMGFSHKEIVKEYGSNKRS